MKNFVTLLAAVTVILFASCGKEELPAPASNPTSPVVSNLAVTYKVTSVSGHFNVTSLTYENGVQKEVINSYDRTNVQLTFNAPAGSMLSVKAKNSIPAADEITVEIWVNGVVFKEASSDVPGSYAQAEGQY